MTMNRWLIYGLLGECGCVFYVGITNNAKRRMLEHAQNYGSKPKYVVLESGAGRDLGFDAELRWIAHFSERGILLVNKVITSNGGRATHCASTRARLSRIGRGKPKPVGFGERLSSLTKGKPRPQSSKSIPTRFKPGRNTYAALTDEQRENWRAANKKLWDGMSPEERSKSATERNLATWARRTPEQRADFGAKISTAPGRGEKIRAAVTTNWASMTSEERATRGAAISAAKRAAFAARRATAPQPEIQIG